MTIMRQRRLRLHIGYVRSMWVSRLPKNILYTTNFVTCLVELEGYKNVIKRVKAGFHISSHYSPG